MHWEYHGIVLEEPFHLSFPCVFEAQQAVYMIPESVQANAVRLYRATAFPGHFELVAELIKGEWADPSIFHHAGRWWLFASKTPFGNQDLHLFSASHLEGPWLAHPLNPVVAKAKHLARPAGRVIQYQGQWLRLAQDCSLRYGAQVMAAHISELSVQKYQERPYPHNPLLSPDGGAWQAGMHHIDMHKLGEQAWIACVDGDNYQIPADLLRRYS